MVEVVWLGSVEYECALGMQNDAVDALISGRGGERLLLLEHDPAVFTIGRTRDVSSLGDIASLQIPVHEIQRGGQATWHGPGQLVGYPILNIGTRGRDLHRYLRFLEDVIMETCRHYHVQADRRAGMTGVWADEGRKIASLGVGVRKWISLHGFALNVTAGTVRGFSPITPCGISGVEMTSLERESGRTITVSNVAEVVAEIFSRREEELGGSVASRD